MSLICPVCPKVVHTLPTLKFHVQNDHKTNLYSMFVCKVENCGRIFSKYNSYSSHVTVCYGKVSKPVDSATSITSIDVDENISSVFTPPEPEVVVTNSDTPINIVTLNHVLKASADKFVAQLYAKPKLPRSYVQSIVKGVSSFVSIFQSELKNLVIDTLQECQAPSDKVDHIANSFDLTVNAFSHLSTEYRRIQHFMKLGSYVPPVSHKIGVLSSSKSTKCGKKLCYKSYYVHSIPLKIVLKKFLELPDCFQTMLDYMNSLSLESDAKKENFMQCKLWKEKRSRYKAEDIVFPINVYCDSVESNNALGSHKTPLEAVYVSSPSLPPECQSSLDNIFLALLFKSSYKKLFSHDKLFGPLISMLISLEKDGIIVSTKDGDKKVYFVTSLLLGDNKGLNDLCGIIDCFSGGFFCRFCKCNKSVTETQCVEDASLLRTETSYNEDVAIGDPSSTGVTKPCVFNKIPSFHVSKNFSVDHFHDMAEGICHYVALHLLKHCIPKYFSIETLNDRIRDFNYGCHESNKIPPISSSFGSNRKLNMSGSETLMFVRLLGLIVGDLVPEDDPFWKLHLKLNQILDICLAKSLPSNTGAKLRVLVKEFCTMYVTITGDTLKAKMHFLLHYALAFEMSSTFESMSTKRYESKHRDLTVPAHATTSRVQITFTLSMRHQLAQCFRFLCGDSILPSMKIGPGDITDLSDIEGFLMFKKTLPDSFVDSLSVLCVSWVEIKGTVYKPGQVLLVSVNLNGPVFAELLSIFVRDETVSFLVKYLLNIGPNEHVHAFAVSSTEFFACKQPETLYDPLPLSIYRDVSGQMYVPLRYGL
ncbi:uncharacterized protein LOC117642795 [Thrips palmi]|uniref:Uncharacterized protein LOC117642795 n=1 Tax=Thrips palmi TaxID=161013 RepID=A0A6P8YC57_THRPL|nr:uncharacterized protein LOC117642795 [Thrips palmi]